jgi:hypothetical protein
VFGELKKEKGARSGERAFLLTLQLVFAPKGELHTVNQSLRGTGAEREGGWVGGREEGPGWVGGREGDRRSEESLPALP